VVDVRISGKGTGQSKTTASGQRVPNFGFVVFVDEKSVTVLPIKFYPSTFILSFFSLFYPKDLSQQATHLT